MAVLKGLIVAAKGYVGPHANTFLLAADVVIAADNTRISWEESRVGVGAPYGPYALMPFHFPIRVMKQLWMTGGWIYADTARQLFYVNRVVAVGQEEEMAMRFAGRSRGWRPAISWPTSGVPTVSMKRLGFPRWSTWVETHMFPAPKRQSPRNTIFG